MPNKMAGQLDVFLKGYEYLTRINIKSVFSNYINVMSCIQFLAGGNSKTQNVFYYPKYQLTDNCMVLCCALRQLPKNYCKIIFDEQTYLCLWKKRIGNGNCT